MVVFCVTASQGQLTGHFFHDDWRQSISTHETARVIGKEEFALCFGVNNYYANWSKHTRGADLLLYDIMIRYGILKNLEFGLKYSYSNSALIRLKYGLLKKPIQCSVSFGIGQYKLTNQDYRTDYIIDLYPGLIFESKIYKKLSFYIAPKLIYSLFIADRYADSETPPRKPWQTEKCYQYGYCWGFALGSKTRFIFENTWHWVNYEGFKYKIHMHGFSITRLID